MLAADYDWMYGDDALAHGRAIKLPATARLLERISPDSAVLDAACGTGREAMVEALVGLRRMARPGGHVVIDSRNWEKLHAEHRIVQIADRVVTRGGRRCVTLYAWEVPDRADAEHIAHLVFIFENGDRIEPHEYQIRFQPFTIGELRERPEIAGLREVDTDFDDSRDRYAVVTVPA